MDELEVPEWDELSTKLSSDNFQKKILEWKTEGLGIRPIVKEFWQCESQLLRTFWETEANSNLKLAILEASLDDLPERFGEAFVYLTCPEIGSDELLGPTLLPSLYDLIVSGTEGTSLNDSEGWKDLPTDAVVICKEMRSVVLLNYLQNVSLVYQQADITVPHISLTDA